jgi:MFS family permease
MAQNASTRQNSFAAFKSSDFRLYFIGQLISISGTWMQNLAQGYLVFQLTKSEAWLGIVACAAGLPFVALAPLAGVLVEQFPRRRLLFMTQTVQMFLAFILAALTFTDTVQVWHIVLLAFLLGVTNAIDLPARQSFVIEVVGDDLLQSGIALNSVLTSASRVLGPMAAGLALARFGPAWCFLLNGLSFVAVLAMLGIMRVPYAIKSAPRTVSPLEGLRQGLDFCRHHDVIMPLLVLAAIGGISIVPLIQILPAFADVVLRSPADGYASITVTQGIGSVIAGMSVGWLSMRLGFGRLLIVSAAAATLATVLLAMQKTVPTAAVMTFLSGASMIMFFVSVNTSIQKIVPNEYRGRVMALYTLSFMGIAPFSALLLGFLASWLGTPTAMIIFAVAGIIGVAWVYVRWPSIVWLGVERSPQSLTSTSRP